MEERRDLLCSCWLALDDHLLGCEHYESWWIQPNCLDHHDIHEILDLPGHSLNFYEVAAGVVGREVGKGDLLNLEAKHSQKDSGALRTSLAADVSSQQ